jgi:hypothetical protein
MAMRRRADVNEQQLDDALDDRRGDLKLSQPQNAPAAQSRFEILLGVRGKTLWPLVAPLDVDATFDLDERAAVDVSDIGAPFALGVKDEFPSQFSLVVAGPDPPHSSAEPVRGSARGASETAAHSNAPVGASEKWWPAFYA